MADVNRGMGNRDVPLIGAKNEPIRRPSPDLLSPDALRQCSSMKSRVTLLYASSCSQCWTWPPSFAIYSLPRNRCCHLFRDMYRNKQVPVAADDQGRGLYFSEIRKNVKAKDRVALGLVGVSRHRILFIEILILALSACNPHWSPGRGCAKMIHWLSRVAVTGIQLTAGLLISSMARLKLVQQYGKVFVNIMLRTLSG